MRLNGGQLTDRQNKIIAKHIALRLPFAWPASPRTGKGALEVGRLQWKNHRAGSLKGLLAQQGQGLAFDLKHESKLFPDLFVILKGEADASGARMDLRLPAYEPARAVELGQFVPAAEGFRAGGRLEARANLHLSRNGLSGTAALTLVKGHLAHSEQKLMLSGIETRIEIEDLAAFRSPDNQTLRIDRMQLDQIQADRLAVDFWIVSPERVRINTSSLAWCP